jgi:hypothetical protein
MALIGKPERVRTYLDDRDDIAHDPRRMRCSPLAAAAGRGRATLPYPSMVP